MLTARWTVLLQRSKQFGSLNWVNHSTRWGRVSVYNPAWPSKGRPPLPPWLLISRRSLFSISKNISSKSNWTSSLRPIIISIKALTSSSAIGPSRLPLFFVLLFLFFFSFFPPSSSLLFLFSSSLLSFPCSLSLLSSCVAARNIIAEVLPFSCSSSLSW